MKTIRSYNPADGSIVGIVNATDISEIETVIKKAQHAQKKWASMDVDDRISVLIKAGRALMDKAENISLLLSMEMGKNLRRSMGEVSGSAGSIEYVAASVKEAIKPIVFEGGRYRTTVSYGPLGVCGIISPWNYPVSMAHWMIIPALTAGNAVVLKPSEETPLVAEAYVNALNEILPDGLLQIIFGDEEQGKALVESDTDLIGFTGSIEAGRDIMRRAALSLKPLIMELGGKDPLIVLKDADVDGAAGFAVANSLENSGQMCISTERIFVDSSIAEEFREKVKKHMSYYKVGPYTDPNAEIGPIINERQRSRILDHIRDAVEKGAEMVIGGREHPERYVLPTVLWGVRDDMLIAKEETFGPVVCVTEFSDVEEAVKKANNTDYGLGAVVFGREGSERVAKGLNSGMIGINTSAGGGGNTPWVGAKQSGFGYHGSPDGHRQFTQPKVVNEAVYSENIRNK